MGVFGAVVNNMFSIAYARLGVNCYNACMEISQIERAQVIINTLKARVHALEEALLAEQTAHQLTQLSYQKEDEQSTANGRRYIDG